MKLFLGILELIIVAWASLALLRFFLQKGGLHISHPLAQLCAQVTDFLVKPARKIIKPVRGWDMAIIALTFFVLLVWQTAVVIFFLIKGLPFSGWTVLYLVGNALLLWTKALAYALIICLIIQMVLSFSNPYNSLMAAVNRILKPLTRPFSFLRIGMVDFSGSLIFIALWLWVSVVVPYGQYLLKIA